MVIAYGYSCHRFLPGVWVSWAGDCWSRCSETDSSSSPEDLWLGAAHLVDWGYIKCILHNNWGMDLMSGDCHESQELSCVGEDEGVGTAQLNSLSSSEMPVAAGETCSDPKLEIRGPVV